jgi:hypothetical protein
MFTFVVAAAFAGDPAVRLAFDTAAVDGFLAAMEGDPPPDGTATGRGAVGMVRNTIKYVPGTDSGVYVASLDELWRTGRVSTEGAYLDDAIAQAATVRDLVGALRADAAGLGDRIAARLAPEWAGEPTVAITVYLVVGGASDGFVLDGETAPELYVAIDRAGGDLGGLEQNVTHEAVHVLQNQFAIRHCPGRRATDALPPVDRFTATVYAEGVANYLADPADVAGDGPYLAMWRERYARNATPERRRENRWLYDTLLGGLRDGALSWETAYRIGFAGDFDSRVYFVGREMAAALSERGVPLVSEAFVCEPDGFVAASGRKRR